MSCTTSDMQVIRRDDVAFEITFKDSDGVAIDITGATVFFTVKKRITDPDSEAVISKTITSFTDPTNGLATLQLSNTDTDITPGKYVFDIQLKTVDNKIASSSSANFFVNQDVTIRTT